MLHIQTPRVTNHHTCWTTSCINSLAKTPSQRSVGQYRFESDKPWAPLLYRMNSS